MRRLFWLWLLALALVFACGEPFHVFVGRAYDGSRDCFLASSAMDVVSGGDAIQCKPRCFVMGKGNTRDVFVSAMCEPFPRGFDVDPDDDSCPPALEAWDRKDYCTGDAGSSNPKSGASGSSSTTSTDDASSS